MAKINILNIAGEQAGEMEIDDNIFKLNFYFLL